MKHTKAAIAALLVSIAMVLSACGGSSKSSDDASGPPTGTITLWARDSEKLFINQLAALYNKSHSAQVKVTVIPAFNFVQKFGTAVASGSGPDVSSIDLVYAPYFASQGALDDITDLVNALPYKDSLGKAHMAQATFDGKIYALPFTGDASVMFYNKTLFKKAGLDPNKPPTNFAEWENAAKKIRTLGPDYYGFAFAGACGGCDVFEVTPSVWASSGDVLSKDGSKAALDSTEVGDTLAFYRQLWTDGVMPSWVKNDAGVGQVPAFTGGKLGMTSLGAFALSTAQQSKIDFGLALIPGKSGGTASFAGGDEIEIPKGSKNKSGAEDFVKWATDEQAQTFLAKSGSVPIRTDLVSKIYDPLGPAYKTFGQAMAIGRTPYSVVENAIFNDNNGPWVKMIDEAVFGSGVQPAQSAGQKAAQQLIDTGQ